MKKGVAASMPDQTTIANPYQPNVIRPYFPDLIKNTKTALLPVKPQTPSKAQNSLVTPNAFMQTKTANGISFSEKKVTINRGDTLINLLVKKASVPHGEAYEAVQALKKVYDPRKLNLGHEITVFFYKDPLINDGPKFSGVRIEKDIINTVTVNRDDEGHYIANKLEKGTHRTLRGFKGVINNSLYVDAKASGVPDAVILDFIKMYSWNVDFQRDIHTGDKFEVMYEEYKTDDYKRTVPGKGNIIYAMLSLGGNDMLFYRYQDRNKMIDYYDNKGKSAKKTLMRTPINGARISSGYGMRKHPILGYSKMHKGLDFAAPSGTPIYAAGDGVIERIGRYSTYGKYIRIRHKAGLKTVYAHMRGYKSGLRKGSRVKQGQTIGYVGSTGRSTGPHLHYEIVLNNKSVNPATVKLPTGKSLRAKDMNIFKGVVAQTQEQFNNNSYTTDDNDQPKAEMIAAN